MNMSWSNPSFDEASEAYSYYKSQYYDAASQREASIRQENKYISEKNAANNQKNELTAQKINFEKRLEGIIKIIKMLEGSGSVPSSIAKVIKTTKKADESFKSAIKHDSGLVVSIETAFKTKSVEEDGYSASALQKYKNEKNALEQNIENLKKQINALSEQISSLASQISSCNAVQASLKRTMNSSAYEMNHYRKYMY